VSEPFRLTRRQLLRTLTSAGVVASSATPLNGCGTGAQQTTSGASGALAGFLTTFDAWLTPTMSEPPALIGEITSTQQQPLRAAERGGRTVAYPLVVANITGNPAMSLPLWWNAEGLPIGVHVLGRYGDEATLFSWPPSWKPPDPGPTDDPRSTLAEAQQAPDQPHA
jgi:Asp-tRNA(Asn)/Glu-tRNA(Gln) amidotransferase A subunit family amidase